MVTTKTDLKHRLGKFLRSAYTEPVMITDHGDITHVLMSVEDYERLTKEKDQELTPSSGTGIPEKG